MSAQKDKVIDWTSSHDNKDVQNLGTLLAEMSWGDISDFTREDFENEVKSKMAARAVYNFIQDIKDDKGGATSKKTSKVSSGSDDYNGRKHRPVMGGTVNGKPGCTVKHCHVPVSRDDDRCAIHDRMRKNDANFMWDLAIENLDDDRDGAAVIDLPPLPRDDIKGVFRILDSLPSEHKRDGGGGGNLLDKGGKYYPQYPSFDYLLFYPLKGQGKVKHGDNQSLDELSKCEENGLLKNRILTTCVKSSSGDRRAPDPKKAGAEYEESKRTTAPKIATRGATSRDRRDSDNGSSAGRGRRDDSDDERGGGGRDRATSRYDSEDEGEYETAKDKAKRYAGAGREKAVNLFALAKGKIGDLRGKGGGGGTGGGGGGIGGGLKAGFSNLKDKVTGRGRSDTGGGGGGYSTYEDDAGSSAGRADTGGGGYSVYKGASSKTSADGTGYSQYTPDNAYIAASVTNGSRGPAATYQDSSSDSDSDSDDAKKKKKKKDGKKSKDSKSSKSDKKKSKSEKPDSAPKRNDNRIRPPGGVEPADSVYPDAGPAPPRQMGNRAPVQDRVSPYEQAAAQGDVYGRPRGNTDGGRPRGNTSDNINDGLAGRPGPPRPGGVMPMQGGPNRGSPSPPNGGGYKAPGSGTSLDRFAQGITTGGVDPRQQQAPMATGRPVPTRPGAGQDQRARSNTGGTAFASVKAVQTVTSAMPTNSQNPRMAGGLGGGFGAAKKPTDQLATAAGAKGGQFF